MTKCRMFFTVGLLNSLVVACVTGDVLSAAAEGVEVSPTGDLVWKDSRRPAYLVSTTARWTNFRTRQWQRARMAAAAKEFPSYGWIYGEANTIAKMKRMGFNALNPFALPTGYLPLLPGYRKGLTPEQDFLQLERLVRRFGWRGKGLNVLGNPRRQSEWEPCLRELRALTNMPFYIDLYTSRPSRLSRQSKIVGKKLDVDRLFYPDAGNGFSQTFRLTSEPGRAALTSLYVKDAETYRSLGVKPFAYKLLNEPNYTDDSDEFKQMLSAVLRRQFGGREVSETVRSIEAQKLRERLMSEMMRDVRSALHGVEPATPTFVQVHSEAWRKNWNGIDLYSMNRNMDMISIGTAGYSYDQPERGEVPSQGLVDALGRYAFYRAMAGGKPLLASEAYFGGMGQDRTPWLEKMLWYQAAEGVSLANLWEWNHPFSEEPKVPFALANAKGCRPETWDSLPRIVQELNALADFFPAGVRHVKSRVACLFSTATQRFDEQRMTAWCEAVAALELGQIRTDAIFEEQLVPGGDCRISDYDVIVAVAVDEMLATTAEALVRWMDAGGRLVVVDATMDRNEYGEKLPGSSPKPLSHANCVNIAAGQGYLRRSQLLLGCLEQLGVRSLADVKDLPTGRHPHFVRLVRASNPDGLTGWFVANYADESKLLTIASPELAGCSSVQPYGENLWPTTNGVMSVIVPARFHTLAITGPRDALERRFGTKSELGVAELRAAYDKMVVADRARAPRRASVPIDISEVANAGFDNQQGWADDTAWDDAHGHGLVGVPYHAQTYRHIDFDVIRFDFNRNRTTIALASKTRPYGLACTPPLALGGQRIRGLAILGAVTHARLGETAAVLNVTYADGGVVQTPLRTGLELGDWRVDSNGAEMRSNCVWQTRGRGFFLYEWQNPRPSEEAKALSLKGGDGESSANIVAISFLPTQFVTEFSNRLVLSAGEVLSTTNSCVFKMGGEGFALNESAYASGVLRYEVRQCEEESGRLPQFQRAVARAQGVLASGEESSTDSHNCTVIGRSHIMGVRKSVVSADEWAEVEIPLALICNGQNSAGRVEPMVSVKHLFLGGSPQFQYRNVRLEY